LLLIEIIASRSVHMLSETSLSNGRRNGDRRRQRRTSHSRQRGDDPHDRDGAQNGAQNPSIHDLSSLSLFVSGRMSATRK
jgi:hypothetical protein